MTYLEHRTDPNLMHQNLYMAMNFNLKESVGWALKVAKDKNAQPFVRATASAPSASSAARSTSPTWSRS